MPKDIREKIFYATTDQIVLQMSAAMPRELDDPGANEIIERHQATMISEMKQIMGAHIPRLMEAWARSYTVVFTKEELTDILDFVSTPSGQKFFTRSSAVVAEANYAAANQAFMSEAMAALPARRDALVKELTDYFADKKTVPEPVES